MRRWTMFAGLQFPPRPDLPSVHAQRAKREVQPHREHPATGVTLPLHMQASAPQEYKEAARASEETGIELIPNESNIFVWRGLLKARARSKWYIQAARVGGRRQR